jgi:hypothetical protein
MVHQSNQPTTEELLVENPLEGSLSFRVLQTIFIFLVSIFDLVREEGLRCRHPHCLIWMVGMNTTGSCLIPQGDHY